MRELHFGLQALHNAHVVGEFLFVVGSLHTVDVALEEFVNIGRVAARLAEVVLEFAFALRHGHTHFVAEGVDVGLAVIGKTSWRLIIYCFFRTFFSIFFKTFF